MFDCLNRIVNGVKLVTRTRNASMTVSFCLPCPALPRLLTRNPGQVAFMAGTLGAVSEADKAMGECDYYRLGRLFFDGADADWIATREQISQADVQAAWEFCREKLSYFLTTATGEEVKLLSDADLFERAEDCVRLLLYWHEVLSENERWSQAMEEQQSGAGAADEKEL